MGWEVLIGLLGIAVSIFFGLNTLSKTLYGSLREIQKSLSEIQRNVATKRDILAIAFAISIASEECRGFATGDLREGYNMADEFLERKDSLSPSRIGK